LASLPPIAAAEYGSSSTATRQLPFPEKALHDVQQVPQVDEHRPRFWNNALVYYLDVMNEQITLIESPAATGAIGHASVPRPASPWLALTDVALSSIKAVGDATRRTVATQRCLRILNSVTRLEQRGVQVTGLADLKLPVEESTDPFTGKPLLMKRLPAGWVIYSVGGDSKDDGGQLANAGQFVNGTDVGLGPVPALPPLK
jgi:hypothetical protein